MHLMECTHQSYHYSRGINFKISCIFKGLMNNSISVALFSQRNISTWRIPLISVSTSYNPMLNLFFRIDKGCISRFNLALYSFQMYILCRNNQKGHKIGDSSCLDTFPLNNQLFWFNRFNYLPIQQM